MSGTDVAKQVDAQRSDLTALARAATPGPWKWRTDANGQGEHSTHLDSLTGKWERCSYYCFGWDADDERHRGPIGQPGHEHLTDPTVIDAIGWHGSGDTMVEEADAAYIAAMSPDVTLALLDALTHAEQRTRDLLGRDELRRIIHDEYQRSYSAFGCVHQNQYPASWDCEKRVREIWEARAAIESPEEETT